MVYYRGVLLIWLRMRTIDVAVLSAGGLLAVTILCAAIAVLVVALIAYAKHILGRKLGSYLDEIVIEPDFDESFGHTPESTRRDLLALNIIVSPIFLLIFVFFALLFCLSLWPFVLIGIWSVVYQALQLSWVIRIVAFGVLMLLGWGMYKLREARRDIYGVGEVCVGATMCWFGVNAATADALPSIIAIAGGVYVIVRGLDNYFQGRKERDADVQPKGSVAAGQITSPGYSRSSGGK